ncbi:MAG: DUF748 domain-containing protein [Desulfomonilia bacterium]|nr:DUF748 domain-containing protein [Desulfomonilia bacterium]
MYVGSLRKVFLWMMIILGAYSLAGFFILPPVMKSMMIRTLSQTLNRPVAVEGVKLNPFTLSLTVEGIDINDQDGTSDFVSVRSLFINLQSLSAIKRALIISEARIDEPRARIVRLSEDTFNFSDLLATDDAPPGKPLNFSVENIQIFDGRIDVLDAPLKKTHVVSDIDLAIPFISNIDYFSDVFVQPRFDATVNGKLVSFRGETKPFADSLETRLDIAFENIDIPYYLSYIPQKLEARIPSGFLDITASLIFLQHRDRKPTVELEGTFVLKDFVMLDIQDNPMIGLPELMVKLAPSRPLENHIHLERIAVTSPELVLIRHANGTVNLDFLGDEDPRHATPDEKESERPPLALAIDTCEITQGSFRFMDLSVRDPVKISMNQLTLNARGLSTSSQVPAELVFSCALGETGSFNAQSSLLLEPVSGEATFALKGVELAWFQPYISEVLDLLIKSGRASATGSVSFSAEGEESLNVAFQGDTQVQRFASVDKANAEDFLTFNALSLKNISFTPRPRRLSIRDISLVDPSLRITVFEDGSLNVEKILAGKPEYHAEIMEQGTPAPQTDETFDAIEVEKVYLTRGLFAFHDRSITPPYSSELSYIDGSISGLSSEASKRADVSLSARLNNHAPLSIAGTINPLHKDLYVDLKAALTDIDLSQASPYSGKYVGYTIHKGKLSLDLEYLIQAKNLQSNHIITVDQLTFGETVSSPDSLNLPVKLAVALLKDRQGRIDLALPVTGRIDDPEFKIGRIIFQMIVNIVTKAAASPFSALAALYPGAEQLQYVEFSYGATHLSDDSLHKIQTIGQILTDRPSLSLELQGFIDVEQDRQALITSIFERKLKAQKLSDMLKKGVDPGKLDEVTIESQEYEDYLKMAYKAETFPKPKNVLGLDKALPREEMEKMILDHITVREGDLRTLAVSRAQAVLDILVQDSQVGADRVFLLEPSGSPPEIIEGVSNARVTLNIQ